MRDPAAYPPKTSRQAPSEPLPSKRTRGRKKKSSQIKCTVWRPREERTRNLCFAHFCTFGESDPSSTFRSILCHLHPQTLSSMAKCYKLAVKGFDIDDLRIEDRRDSKIENMAPSDDKVSWQHDMPPASIACNSPSTSNVRELPQCTSMLCCSNHDNREGYHAVGKTYRCWVEVQLTSGNTFEMHVGCCKMFINPGQS